jgi:hypothetical protein
MMTFQVLRKSGFLWDQRDFKVEIRRELVNDRADPVQELWHPNTTDVLGELVCRPLLFAFQFCEVEGSDGVTIKGSVFSLDDRVMAINSGGALVRALRAGKLVVAHF